MDVSRDRKFFSHVGFSYFALAVLWLGVANLLSLLVYLLFPVLASGTLVSMFLSDAALYLLAMPVCLLIMRRLPNMELRRQALKFGHWLIYLIMAFFVMYAGNIVGILVNAGLSRIVGHEITPNVQELINDLPMGWLFLLVVVAAPILEELVFRKLLIDRVIVYGDKAAILLSGLMFGLFHGNFSQFFYAWGLGMLLAYVYIRYGNIKHTIALHMVINLFGGLIASGLLKNLGMDDILNNPSDPNAMMQVMFNHIGAWIGLMLLGLFVIAMFIAGLVLFIVRFKRARLLPGERTLPGRTQVSVMLLNPGMILFYIATGYMFVQSIVLG